MYFTKKFGKFVILFLLFLSWSPKEVVCSFLEREVTINGMSHRILGSSTVINNVQVEHFAKIPYARPPIGDLRFKHPQELLGPSWTGLYNSTAPPNTCWQPDGSEFDKLNPAASLWLSKTTMNEDCLYLTIWVPKVPETKLSVMVWIYGGGFISGSSTLEVYDGSILASKHKVVVVSLQYRLGPLGFMYINDKLAPGNQGLMDQRLALKWIKNNIASFNGDPNSITIFGESAGAGSVSLHVLSPLSKNLFNRAIMESGTALAPWVVDSQKESLEKTMEFAKICNCGYGDMDKLSYCLNKIDPSILVNLQFKLSDYSAKKRLKMLKEQFVFNVVSDASFILDIPFRAIYDDFFIPKSISSLLIEQRSRNDIELLTGFNSNEGSYFLLYGLNKWLNFFQKESVVTTDRLSSLNPNSLDIHKLILENLLHSKYAYEKFVPLFMYEYKIPSTVMGYKEWTSIDVLSALDQMIGDEMFVCPVIQFAERMVENGRKVYVYNFGHRTERITFPKWTGSMHGYEVEYVFGMPYSKTFTSSFYNFSQIERELSDNVMLLWTNFAKFGNPTPTSTNYFGTFATWGLYNTSNPQMFHLTTSKEKPFIKNEKSNKCKFWAKVLPSLIRTRFAESKSINLVPVCWILFLSASKVLISTLVT